MKVLLLLAVVAMSLVVVSCSTGPTPPQPGTPAFYWNAAKETYHGGDFVKADENLSEIMQSDSEFTAKARVWHMVMAAGLTQAYGRMADAYEMGAKETHANPQLFRRQVSALRTAGSHTAMEFTQAAHDFAKDQSAEVLFAFEYPAGSMTESAALNRVSTGTPLPEMDAASLQKAMLQRGVVMALCKAAGSPDDSAKVLDKFKASEVKIPRATFVAGLARLLYEDSDIFGAKRLDQPQRFQVMLEEAAEMVKAAPETKETKDLSNQIQNALKKLKKGSGGV